MGDGPADWEGGKMIQSKKSEGKRKKKLADPNHLLKEYELCWQSLHNHNRRLWMSASIFLPGTILALKWLTGSLGEHEWAQFILVVILAILFLIIMGSYLRIFGVWEFLDRVELYRALEIEQDLRLWKARYRHYARESENPPEEDSSRLDSMRETIAKRLRISVEDLPKRRANLHFRVIIYCILGTIIAVVVWAFVITFGWLNLVSVLNTFVDERCTNLHLLTIP
jgi:hypothetical protein